MKIDPIRMNIGNWLGIVYDQKIRVDGRLWYHIQGGGFGSYNDRHDWVLWLPEGTLSISVCKWKNEKTWKGGGKDGHKTRPEAMRAAVAQAANAALYELTKLKKQLVFMEEAANILKE